MWKLVKIPVAGRYWSNIDPYHQKYEVFDATKHIPLLNSIDSDNQYDYLANAKLFRTKEYYEENTELPNGIYKLVYFPNHGHYLAEYELPKDEALIDFSITSSILEDFNAFMDNKQIYHDLNISYKRGILLYGPPGTGKSCLINRIVSGAMKQNYVTVFIGGTFSPDILQGLRRIKALKILIFEEFTNYMNPDGTAPESILSLLDGDSSMSNTFIIASTNYPERLPINIVNRPGRFDKFYFLGRLNQEDIIKYAARFDIHFTETVLEKLGNVSIAVLKEILLRSKLTKQSIETVIKEIDKQSVFIKESSVKDKNISRYIL